MKNTLAWFQERFPVLNFLTAFIMYAMVASVARHFAGLQDLRFGFVDFLGALNLSFYLLILRVADEHKDYQTDLKNFPKRVLQSGRITLSQLRKIAAGCLVFIFITCMIIDGGIGPAAAMAAVSMLMAFLMYKEFYVGDWLKHHMMIYGLLHLVSAPIMALWIIAMSTPSLLNVDADLRSVALLIFLPFFAGMAFELVRKSFGQEEETATLESYSRIFGSRKISAFIAFFMIGTLSLQLALMQVISADAAGRWRWIPWSGFVLALIALAIYAFRPEHRFRKLNEAATGIFVLSNYVLLLAIA